MKILIDTHALIWWLHEPENLPKKARKILSDVQTTVLVSAAVAWEIAIKANIGKLRPLELALDLSHRVAEEGFFEEPITIEHSVRAGFLPLHHRDPFDRLLVAQAQALNIPILSGDETLRRYDVKRIW